MRRFIRVTFKLGLVAAVVVGVAVVVKKLTAPAPGASPTLEPWPPLADEAPTSGANGEAPASEEATASNN